MRMSLVKTNKRDIKKITKKNNFSKMRKKDFLSSAGSWENINTEKLKQQIYENRKISTRKAMNL